MSRVITITADSIVSDGFYFDALCTHPEKATHRVRFIFFKHNEKLKRAILSDNSEFFVDTADLSCIPSTMRFPMEFTYAGFISPYGYESNTVGAMLNLMNRCMGRYKFSLIENQTITLNDAQPKVKNAPNEFVSPNYESKVIYTEQHGYHFSHSAVINQPKKEYKYRIGVELEVEANSFEKLDAIRKTKSNWFFMERDGSLNDYGVEFVTIPLLPKDARNPKFWAPLCDFLEPIAQSWSSRHCGLHVHIGREILGKTEDERSATLGKLLYVYHHFLKNSRLNSKIFGREQGYHDIECTSGLVRAVEILGNKVLKKPAMRDAIDKDLKDKSRTDRYFDINIQNSATIEFRRGKGSLRPLRIAAIVEYCETLCDYAKKAKWEKISYDDFLEYLKKNAKSNLKELLHEVYPII